MLIAPSKPLRQIIFTALLLISAIGLPQIISSAVIAEGEIVTEQPRQTGQEVTIAELSGKNQYIVSLNPPFVGGPDRETTATERELIRNSRELVIERNKDIIEANSVTQYDYVPAFSATINPSDVEALKNDPLVAEVRENKIRFLQLDQSVPHIGSDTVQSAGFDGSDTAVAILDTGVARHQFVNIISEACYSNSGGFGGGISVCPDGSTSTTADNSADACDNIAAGCDHGTHVAGIAAGTTNRPRVNITVNKASAGLGGTVTASISLETGSKDVVDFDLNLTYETANLSFVSFVENTGSGVSTSSPISPLDGTIDLNGSSIGTSVSGSSLAIGTVTFAVTSSAPTTTDISFARSTPAQFTFLGGEEQKPSLGHISLPIESTETTGSITTAASAAFTGVAPGAGIIAVQVFTSYDTATCNFYFGYSPCIGASDSDIIAGLNRVLTLHNDSNFTPTIASVNMSLGSGIFTSQESCDSSVGSGYINIVNSLRAVGIPTIISSGNNGSSTGISAPGCMTPAIAVGSTTISDAVSSFSNSSDLVELLAPGSSIRSSVPGNGFSSFSGTSMAAPHVAGAWAQLKQIDPSFTVNEILDVLTETGSTVVDSRNSLSFTRIDTSSAEATLNQPVSLTTTGDTTSEGGQSVYVDFKLNRAPTSPVTIPVSISVASEASLSASEVVISPTNWNQSENNRLTITGLDDSVVDGSVPYTLITGDPASSDGSFNALEATDVQDVMLTNLDNDILETYKAKLVSRTFFIDATDCLWAREGITGTNVLQTCDVDSYKTEAQRVGVIKTNGQLWMKEGSLYAPWIRMTTNVDDFVMEDRRVIVLRSDGTTYAKDGSINGPWLWISSDVIEVELSGTSRIGVRKSNGSIYIKSPGLSSPWTWITNTPNSFQLINDRIAVDSPAFGFIMKEGGISSPWIYVTQLDITDYTLTKNRIAVARGGELWVKEGSLSTAWYYLGTGNLTDYDITDGRVIVTHSDGRIYVKDGFLGAGWSTITSLDSQSLDLDGKSIGFVSPGGAAYVKSPNTGSSWTAISNDAKVISFEEWPQ